MGFRMSMETNPTESYASGWSVHENSFYGWQWSAYGPRGGSQGTAKTRAEAERKAVAEAENLKGPRTTWA